MTYHEYDHIKLIKEVPNIPIQVGTFGTIVLAYYFHSKGSEDYEIEFFDENFESLNCYTINSSNFIIVKKNTD